MLRLMRESGGALAKLLVSLLLIGVVASAVLYVYATRQRPLRLGKAVPAPANASDDSSVTIDADGTLRVATVVRNDGRLPVTLEGLGDQPAGPLVATSLGLGDGHDATSAAAFTPTALTPGTGLGIVVVFTLDDTACAGLDDEPTAAIAFPAVALRFSSYGVAATDTVRPEDAPAVIGVTRDVCTGAAAQTKP
jgi:hypothetical protein